MAIIMTGRQIGLLPTAVTTNSTLGLTDAVVVYRETNQPVNSSLCLISSLEVYRGRDEITEIENDGLSLNERGFIAVRTTIQTAC